MKPPNTPATLKAVLRLSGAGSVERVLVFALIAIAVALRLGYYLTNPSLSVDEASLALNVMHRSYSSLLGQLDFNQAAPPGFLLLEKALVEGLGATPYALRLVPLVAGIVSSLLIYPVASRFFERRAAIVALALFAFSDPLISYASTNKQYSSDVAVTLCLYAVALASRTGARKMLVLALTGSVAVWLSHPAAFVLAAIGAVLISERARVRDFTEVAKLAAIGTAWLGSFLIAYALTHSSIKQIQGSIAGGSTLTVLGEHGQPGLLQKYGGIARNLLGVPSLGHAPRSILTAVAMLLALVGLTMLMRSRARCALLLVVPAGLTLIACALNFYPLFPRTFLFLIPGLLILVAAGARSLITLGRSKFLSGAAAGVVAVLLGSTTYATAHHLRSPQDGPFRVLRYLSQMARTGDSLYVYRTAQYDLRYYLECGCFGTSQARRTKALWSLRPASGYAQFAAALKSAPPRLIVGDATTSAAADYRADFQPLQGRRRVWVLLIGANPEGQRGLDAFLSESGAREDLFPRTGDNATASVSLYKLYPPR